MLVNEVSKYSVRVRVLAASRGDSVEAMTDSRHRMPVMRSRLQSGQLRGSRGSSLGCGTRMMPSLPCLTLPWWGVPVCGSVRSSSVAVPGRCQSRVVWWCAWARWCGGLALLTGYMLQVLVVQDAETHCVDGRGRRPRCAYCAEVVFTLCSLPCPHS